MVEDLASHKFPDDIDRIMRLNTENLRCIDCNASDPEWASLGFGTFICLQCAGYHRAFGAHITLVRSLKLDSWTEQQKSFLERGGNRLFSEHIRCNSSSTKDQPEQKTEEREIQQLSLEKIATSSSGSSYPTPEVTVFVGAAVSAAPADSAAGTSYVAREGDDRDSEHDNYGHPRTLYYSELLRARVEERNPRPYIEEEWLVSANKIRHMHHSNSGKIFSSPETTSTQRGEQQLQQQQHFSNSKNKGPIRKISSGLSEKFGRFTGGKGGKVDGSSRHSSPVPKNNDSLTIASPQQQRIVNNNSNSNNNLHSQDNTGSASPDSPGSPRDFIHIGSNGYQVSPKPSQPPKRKSWTPDEKTPQCMLCERKYTLLFRRHHCRRCGKCVCKFCAPKDNTRPIPEWGLLDPVRHCRECFKSPLVQWIG